MIFIWTIVTIAGGVLQGDTISPATTTLTIAIDEDDAVINVTSTNGFPDTGFVNIIDERIGYASKTATSFTGNLAQPVVRGASGTEAVAHVVGERVRTTESAMLNESMNYNLAVITDASGIIAFVTIPWAVLSLLGNFLILPFGFLGTDLQLLTYIWIAISIGILVSIAIALVGGRRV